ncbi:tryptophan synthase subunit alpha [Metabacillus sp. SLBN-84]
MKTHLQNLLSQNKKLFVPFITAGDPNGEATIGLALALQKAGASAIELGIPYSDPLADGPVIQRASQRALAEGMNIVKAMELVPVMRENGLTIPIILFTYYNPVLQLGKESFFALAEKNTIDGLLIPDLPFEESGDLRESCRQHGVTFISMVAPTSSGRLKKIVSSAEGFLYCVSSLGVTGSRKTFDKRIFDFLEEVKQEADVPVLVGFGVSTRQHVEELTKTCDGVVVGSALIEEVERLSQKLKDPDARIAAFEEFQKKAASFVLPAEVEIGS